MTKILSSRPPDSAQRTSSAVTKVHIIEDTVCDPVTFGVALEYANGTHSTVVISNTLTTDHFVQVLEALGVQVEFIKL